MTDPRWNRPCSLSGCTSPREPHHHHWLYGHIATAACRCSQGGEPGTRVSSRPD